MNRFLLMKMYLKYFIHVQCTCIMYSNVFYSNCHFVHNPKKHAHTHTQAKEPWKKSEPINNPPTSSSAGSHLHDSFEKYKWVTPVPSSVGREVPYWPCKRLRNRIWFHCLRIVICVRYMRRGWRLCQRICSWREGFGGIRGSEFVKPCVCGESESDKWCFGVWVWVWLANVYGRENDIDTVDNKNCVFIIVTLKECVMNGFRKKIWNVWEIYYYVTSTIQTLYICININQRRWQRRRQQPSKWYDRTIGSYTVIESIEFLFCWNLTVNRYKYKNLQMMLSKNLPSLVL